MAKKAGSPRKATKRKSNTYKPNSVAKQMQEAHNIKNKRTAK